MYLLLDHPVWPALTSIALSITTPAYEQSPVLTVSSDTLRQLRAASGEASLCSCFTAAISRRHRYLLRRRPTNAARMCMIYEEKHASYHSFTVDISAGMTQPARCVMTNNLYTVNGKRNRFIFFIASTNVSQFKRKFHTMYI